MTYLQCDIDTIKSRLSYNAETGVFIRLGVERHKTVGAINHDGYLRIQVGTHRFYAHRLAWAIVHNEWPKDEIDHINGIRLDNRISNLRTVNRRKNNQNNIKSRNKVKLLGAYVTLSGKYAARMKINGKNCYLGSFETEREAHEVYLLKVKSLNEQ